MAKLKTQKTEKDPYEFLESAAEGQKLEDSIAIMKMMERATGAAPKMWGTSIIGFGSYHYKYESGREADWMLVGFSPRKNALSLYIMPGFAHYDELMQKLGKYKTGKACLYIKKLEDVDREVLGQLINESVALMREKHPTKT